MRSQSLQTQKPGILKRIGWAVILLLAVLVSLEVSRYLTLDPDVFFLEQRAVYMAHLAFLITHIVASMLALLIGPFQFLPRIRKGRLLKVHRWLGRTYLLSILFGGLSGLYMAQFAYGGAVSELGFGVLACLWLYTGFMAYKRIREKDLDGHRRWMIRNYALTFAGVMLRVWVPVSMAMGADFLEAYRVIAWMCWVPNLLVAQWIIRRTERSQSRARVVHPLPQPRAGGETAQTE
jgi:uncharacterized membrane protein